MVVENGASDRVQCTINRQPHCHLSTVVGGHGWCHTHNGQRLGPWQRVVMCRTSNLREGEQ